MGCVCLMRKLIPLKQTLSSGVVDSLGKYIGPSAWQFDIPSQPGNLKSEPNDLISLLEMRKR